MDHFYKEMHSEIECKQNVISSFINATYNQLILSTMYTEKGQENIAVGE